MKNADYVFHPVDGAILDLESLQAISSAENRLLGTWLQGAWPGSSGIVLEGLDLDGEWTSEGPPGTRRPDTRSDTAIVLPGKALVTGRNGRVYLLRLQEELQIDWPTKAGSASRGHLALVPRIEIADVKGGITVARERVSAQLGFVKPNQLDDTLLPIASSLNNSKDWVTDIRRLYQPEHPAVRNLLKQFEKIEVTVWRAEPEGSVWDRSVLGRNWVRYQTVAASCVQSARMVMQTRAMTTLDRVRLVRATFAQLNNSVEVAANELLQMVGANEGVGPYATIGGGEPRS